MSHSPKVLPLFVSTLLVLLAAAPLAAAPKKTAAAGTLTVDGEVTVLKFGWAGMGRNEEEDRELLVLLFADRDLPPADQEPARLLELTQAGKLTALRVIWSTGYDWLAATPYHAKLADSGKRASETPTLNLDAFDEVNIEADVRSKRLGQKVHFNARIAGPITKLSAVAIEPPAQVEAMEHEEAEQAEAAAPTGTDSKSLKLRLGQLGYAFEPEFFQSAVADGNLEAVELFLKLGQSPNYTENDTPTMILAALRCVGEPIESRTPVLKALIAAGGNVEAKDINGSTPLLWAAQHCDAEAVKALIAAKANVNAKAKGGANPLMMAKVFNRTDIVELLVKAGAKE